MVECVWYLNHRKTGTSTEKSDDEFWGANKDIHKNNIGTQVQKFTQTRRQYSKIILYNKIFNLHAHVDFQYKNTQLVDFVR